MFFLSLLMALSAVAQDRVGFKDHQLHVDGVAQPQLFGAEVQYFRMRGGYGPNVPREKVIELWNRALDHAAEAKMSTISFYIPWDFHEYREGKFDFTGTVDEDGDGNADYPSRDIHTFFRLAEEKGFKNIMARPGPYINAEWGFLGFGAIPSWFHDKYPESHMLSSSGGKRALYDYLDPNLLRHTELWFKALKQEVLDAKMGPGKPVVFLQIDNETNYQWQGVYATDYAPRTQKRYQDFLRAKFLSLESLNLAHGRAWKNWDEILPPTAMGKNVAEDQAWFAYTDEVLYKFLQEVRKTWERLGVKEPQILFTLAESYNAPWQGLLPHYGYRNARGKTGLMTVNLYPKTFHSDQKELLNSPFKADLDVISAESANDAYLGSRQDWVLGPEIQGGWWKGTPVTEAARLQTYLTVLGHGMKAIYVYYFNEGHNWGVHWISDKVQEIYQDMRKEREMLPGDRPSNEFWSSLQERVDEEIVQGHNARWLVENPRPGHEELFFDAPLDGNANPRPHFSVLKNVGAKLIAPYQEFLGSAQALNDSVAIVKDNIAHEPSPILDAARASSEFSGGLVGWLLTSSLNPEVLHTELNTSDRFEAPKLLLHMDTGRRAVQTTAVLETALTKGQSVVNFLSDSFACDFFSRTTCGEDKLSRASHERVEAQFYLSPEGRLLSGPTSESRTFSLWLEGPLFSYQPPKECSGILFSGEKVLSYQCPMPSGASFTQVGAPIFAPYNSNFYGNMSDGSSRVEFLQALARNAKLDPQIQLSKEADRVAVFARIDSSNESRKDPKKKLLWITLKTGAKQDQFFELRMRPTFLNKYFPLRGAKQFRIKEPLSEKETLVSREAILNGIPLELQGEEAKVLVVEPVTE